MKKGLHKILVVDDDRALCRSMEIQLQQGGYEVRTTTRGRDALVLESEFRPDLVFLDVQLPDFDGLSVLGEWLTTRPKLPVVMITGRQDMDATIEAVRRGAFDSLRKPLDLEELEDALSKVDELIQSRSSNGGACGEGSLLEPRRGVGPHEIVGRSRGVLDVLRRIGRLADSRVTVLIQGESGTGKELVARALHRASNVGEAEDLPFVAVNCAALSTTLCESEIFGHRKGAFTGAERDRVGRMEAAGRGTLFFDEIGDLPLELQGKLLRTLQEREFERLGGDQILPLRARVLAATHRDLRAMVARDEFRGDLLHRLEVACIEMPPLRDRLEDIPLLVQALLGRIEELIGVRVKGISQGLLDRLGTYDWPGNVRELNNVLLRAISARPSEVLTEIELPNDGIQIGSTDSPEVFPLREVERLHIQRVLAVHGGNVTRCARALEISPTTLRKKIHDYGLRPDRPDPDQSGGQNLADDSASSEPVV